MLLCVLALLATLAAAQDCPGTTFDGVEALVRFLRGNRLMIFEKCVGSELTNAVEIAVNNKEIPFLDRSAFNNIPTLETIILDTCNIYKVTANAFINLPKLDTINIVHNNIGVLSEKLFVNVTAKHLDLSDNQLFNIHHVTFHGANQLKTVCLSHNQLSHYHSKWFITSKDTLTELDLSYNKFSYISKNGFVEYQNLQVLRLNNNRIRAVHPNIFKGLKNMKFIHFEHNRITELDNALTRPFAQSAVTVMLNNNQLNFLGEELLVNLQFSTTHLHSNPWLCACYSAITKWAHKHKIDVIFTAKCQSHEDLPVCINDQQDVCAMKTDAVLSKDFYNYYRKVVCNSTII